MHAHTHAQTCTHTHMQQSTPLVVCSREYQWGCFGRAVSEQSGESGPWSPPGQSQSQQASLQTAVRGHRSGGTDNHTEWMWGSCSLNERRRTTESWICHWTYNVWCHRASLLRTYIVAKGKLIYCIYVLHNWCKHSVDIDSATYSALGLFTRYKCLAVPWLIDSK